MENTVNNKRKSIFTALGAILLVAVTVLGTIAFLTSQTETVTNTFAFGDVSFDEDLNGGLDEALVDEYGRPIEVKDGNLVDADGNYVDKKGNPSETPVPGTEEDLRVRENSYKLVPGKTYVKDPTAHIKAGSEPAHVYVEVVNGLANFEQEELIADQMTRIGWTNVQGNIWRHNDIVDGRDGAKSVVVFEKFTVKDDADTSQTAEDITVKAFAIQSDNITVEAADAEALAHFN